MFLGINNEDTNFCSYLSRRFLTIDAPRSWGTSRRGRFWPASSATMAESSLQPSKIDRSRRGRGTWLRLGDARSAPPPRLPCLINSRRASVNKPCLPRQKTIEWRSYDEGKRWLSVSERTSRRKSMSLVPSTSFNRESSAEQNFRR